MCLIFKRYFFLGKASKSLETRLLTSSKLKGRCNLLVHKVHYVHTVHMNIKPLCTLCATDLPAQPITSQDLSFCCTGCHAVYQVLKSQEQLSDYQEHPVFRQALRSGLISNPDLLNSLQQEIEIPENEWKHLHLEITDLWCPSCAEVIKWIMLKERGVRSCVVDYATDLASIEFSPRHISKEELLSILTKTGYHPVEFGQAKQKSTLPIRFGIAAFFSFNVMMLAYPLYASHFYTWHHLDGLLIGWLSFIAALPALTYCAWPLYRRCFSSLKIGFVGMEALVTTAVSTGTAISLLHLIQGNPHVYFDSMCVIVTLILLGKIIESKAKFSAKESLRRLGQSLPKRARKRNENGEEVFTLLKEIEVGDHLIICAGERISLDGEILEGSGTCDESVMTGEATPLFKSKGDQVIAGSILITGYLIVAVTQTVEEGALYRLLDLITKDMRKKKPYERYIDKIARAIVPAVFGIALATALFVEDPIERIMSILLIACPCAIGIAAPLAESLLLTKLSAKGVIVRNRDALRAITEVDTFIFDKTGTLTEGRYQVLQGLETLTEKESLKALVEQSIHPVANAVRNALSEKPRKGGEVQEQMGYGIRGEWGEEIYHFGSKKFMELSRIETNKETDSYFAKNGEIIAQITLGDRLRPETNETLQAIPGRKIVVSGDHEKAVKRVANSCGIKEYIFEATPLQKREFVLKNKGCFIGDGINDSAALTAASVGISVANASEISIQVSDILLTSKSLSALPELLSLSKQTKRIIFQNLFWAFFFNAIGIAIATLGWLHPLYAAFAMLSSSLIILANTQRIRYTSDQ